MPLLPGSSQEIIRANFKELRKSGRFKESQAWAIAMKHARKGTGKSVAKQVAKADPLKLRSGELRSGKVG